MRLSSTSETPPRKRKRSGPRASRKSTRVNGLGFSAALLLLAGFAGTGLMIYEPALHGEFISDDEHYVYKNPYVTELNAETLAVILDPGSVLTLVVENYAPVHILLHALEWKVFKMEVYGYHVVNVLFHALASILLVVFMRRTGLSRVAACFGGAIFLAHAANVEAVAWISQLKSSSSLVLALSALLVQARAPAVGALLFLLALLAKPSALLALPVLVILVWLSAAGKGAALVPDRRRWLWVGVWCVALLAFAAAELTAFWKTAGYAPPVHDELLVRFRSGAAIGLRYLVMAATTRGLSTFQEPAQSISWFEPWWMGSVVAFGVIGWRILIVLKARRIEAAWWAWTAAAFAPVSGLLALPFPMADRYLYSILPGLIAVSLFVLRDAREWLEASALRSTDDVEWLRNSLRWLGPGLAAAFVLMLGIRAHERAAIWQSGGRMMVDAEIHYPNGTAANTRKATRAARIGDAQTAVKHLRAAYARGYNRLDHLLNEPAYRFMRNDPGFRSLLEDIANEMVGRLEQNPRASQLELHVLALAYQTLRDTPSAIRALERAVRVGGPKDDIIRSDLAKLRARQRQETQRRR